MAAYYPDHESESGSDDSPTAPVHITDNEMARMCLAELAEGRALIATAAATLDHLGIPWAVIALQTGVSIDALMALVAAYDPYELS